MNWAFAGTASLALHVVVLLLFAWSSGESVPRVARDSEKDVAGSVAPESPRQGDSSVDSKQQEPIEPKVSPEPEPKPTPAPEPKLRDKVDQRPKAEPRAKSEPVKTAEKAPAKVREIERAAPQVAVDTYVVRKGDMLTHIAQNHGCTIVELAKLNGTTAKKLANLRVGQKIKVPKKGE